MTVRRKLLASAATIAVASMATIGGSFAYFSDTTSASSKFTNGTIVLKPSKEYLERFNITNFKPGDTLEADTPNQEPAMTLNNQGTLPMNVFMGSTVTVKKSGTNGYVPLTATELSSADSIYFTSLKFGNTDLIKSATNPTGAFDPKTDGKLSLKEFADQTANLKTTLNGHDINNVGKYLGFLDAPVKKADGTPDYAASTAIKSVSYVLNFEDTGSLQNALQGQEISIDFVFTGLQYEGKVFKNTGVKSDGTPAVGSNIDNNSTGGGGVFQRTDNVNDRNNFGQNNTNDKNN